MIKLKDLLKESLTWENRKFGDRLPTLADYKKLKEDSLDERELTANDLLKELTKVNDVVVKILNKYENSIKFYMPQVIQKWMMNLHSDIKKRVIKYD